MHRPRHTHLTQVRSQDLRRRLTVSEARLWSYIRSRKLGARFRRQVAIGIWIVDFASFDPRLVIELDDRSHDFRNETERTAYLEAQGFRVLRFTNREVAMDLDMVLGTIQLAIGE